MFYYNPLHWSRRFINQYFRLTDQKSPRIWLNHHPNATLFTRNHAMCFAEKSCIWLFSACSSKHSKHYRKHKRSRSRERNRSREKKRSRSRDRKEGHNRDRKENKSREKKRSRSRERKRSRSRERKRSRSKDRIQRFQHGRPREIHIRDPFRKRRSITKSPLRYCIF